MPEAFQPTETAKTSGVTLQPYQHKLVHVESNYLGIKRSQALFRHLYGNS